MGFRPERFDCGLVPIMVQQESTPKPCWKLSRPFLPSRPKRGDGVWRGGYNQACPVLRTDRHGRMPSLPAITYKSFKEHLVTMIPRIHLGLPFWALLLGLNLRIHQLAKRANSTIVLCTSGSLIRCHVSNDSESNDQPSTVHKCPCEKNM